MIRSMTGYGKGEVPLFDGAVVCEIKGVNQRGLTVVLRLPHELRTWETATRSWLQDKLVRGKVVVNVLLQPGSLPERVSVDEERVRLLAAAGEKLQRDYGGLRPLSVGDLLMFPGVIVTEQSDSNEDAVHSALQQAVTSALQAFDEGRTVEGEKLATDLRQHLAQLREELAGIGSLAAEQPQLCQRQLHERLDRLSSEIKLDEVRVAQEVALLAERCDINEEIVRLTSHIGMAEEIMQHGGEVGRRLDFVAQEMLREANTIGSKSISLEISQAVLRMKGAIDKIKEQVQNIE